MIRNTANISNTIVLLPNISYTTLMVYEIYVNIHCKACNTPCSNYAITITIHAAATTIHAIAIHAIIIQLQLRVKYVVAITW
ncbi:hypothetical protein B0O99DRAFT_630993 [Bisporella sp. PMI_857]|nr:hypothetical protein B0O99DRAFT_630993 [Bisporella sp. PMI_857]